MVGGSGALERHHGHARSTCLPRRWMHGTGHGATNGEGGRGTSHLGSSINHREQALGATFFPGHLPQADKRYVTDCCAAQVQSTGRRARLVSVRWRGAHQALAQTSTVEARHPGVLGRLRSSWRRSAAICWRTWCTSQPRWTRRPCASYRHARSAADGAISPFRKASDSDAYHSSSCRVGGVRPRDERSRRAST